MLTLDQFKEQVLKLAEENPDFVYLDQGFEDVIGCSYLGASLEDHTEGVGCIMGQAMTALGVSDDDLYAWEGLPIGTILNKPGLFSDVKDCSFERKTLFFERVQSSQDMGVAWGLAVQEGLGGY